MSFSSDIAGAAKKDPAYKKMSGREGSDDEEASESPDEEKGEAKKQRMYLGQAFRAAKSGDEAAFCEAMTAWRTDCAPMR